MCPATKHQNLKQKQYAWPGSSLSPGCKKFRQGKRRCKAPRHGCGQEKQQHFAFFLHPRPVLLLLSKNVLSAYPWLQGFAICVIPIGLAGPLSLDEMSIARWRIWQPAWRRASDTSRSTSRPCTYLLTMHGTEELDGIKAMTTAREGNKWSKHFILSKSRSSSFL